MNTTTSPAGTFAEVWQRVVLRHDARTFLVFRGEDGRIDTWTYGEFDRVVRDAMALLAANGVVAGDAVHLCLRNSPAFIGLWLACTRLGAWMVPVDPASTSRDIESQLVRVSPKVGLYARERAGTYRAGVAEGSRLRTFALEETSADVRAGGRLRAGDGRTAEAAPVAPRDRLAVMFTSGTTSQPKGVVLTQANYRHVAEAMAAAADLGADDRWLVTLPLFHANAQFYCFAPAIHVGASVALTATFSASQWVDTATALGATHASLFAAPIRMILARTPDGTAPAHLRHTWFAQSLGRDHHREFGALTGTLPRQLYGMTETTAIVTADRSDPPSHELIGEPVPGRRVRLVDPTTHEDVADGTPGMIIVAGERGVDLFAEYLDDRAVTDRSFTTDGDGVTWLLTGDLAVRTESGALRFVGRADDVIKVAGENVSLTEVESVLAQAPGVLEVAVVARADALRDHVPVAYVVVRDQRAAPTEDELAAWAGEQLAPQARPREWHFIDSLPRTSVGKVRRFKIGTDDVG
ncbi:MAG TPA: class I adenylate-forming enzyme family protein [Nocardioides sp.]|nr:class I adenylate-forming enzyme family protein [Nocardioides sp.]